MTLKSDLKKANFEIAKCTVCGYLHDWTTSLTNGKHDCIEKYDAKNFKKIKAIPFPTLKKICESKQLWVSCQDLACAISEIEKEEAVKT